MTTSSSSTWRIVLQVFLWVVFAGLCAEAGGILINAAYWLIDKPESSTILWDQARLDDLFLKDRGYFMVICFIMLLIAVLKAILFWNVLRLSSNKDISIQQPFHPRVIKFIQVAAFLALAIGFFCQMGMKYSDHLVENNIKMPAIQHLNFDGSEAWMLMGVSLFVIAYVFKQGIRIQSENELTI